MKKYDIVLVNLNPTRGAEKQGIRPCVVLQNNIANQSRLQTVTIAPITYQIRGVPSMLSVVASKKCGLKIDSCIDFSQMRTLDRGRISKTIGQLESRYYSDVREKITQFLDLFDEYSLV